MIRILTNVGSKSVPQREPFAALVLAHGAGAGQSSSFMVEVARGFASRGVIRDVRLSLYHRPPEGSRSRAGARAGMARRDSSRARRTCQLPLFIGGKSMGGRIATHVAAQKNVGPLSGVLLLGYPLHPPGRPEQRRDTHLPDIVEPMLFVQGERDEFGGTGELNELLPRLHAGQSRNSWRRSFVFACRAERQTSKRYSSRRWPLPPSGCDHEQGEALRLVWQRGLDQGRPLKNSPIPVETLAFHSCAPS